MKTAEETFWELQDQVINQCKTLAKVRENELIIFSYEINDNKFEIVKPVEIPIKHEQISNEVCILRKNGIQFTNEFFKFHPLCSISGIKKRFESGQPLFEIFSLSRQQMQKEIIVDFEMTKIVVSEYFSKCRIITGYALRNDVLNYQCFDFRTMQPIFQLSKKTPYSEKFEYDKDNVVISGMKTIRSNNDGSFTYYDAITGKSSEFIDIEQKYDINIV